MNRRDFLTRCAALGATAPFFAFLQACQGDGEGLYWDFEVNFTGKVVVIGAGAAGLAAGYMLHRYGVDFEIIEAAPRIGGRVKRTDDFADFPIDLGAEWIHEDPSVLAALIDDPSMQGEVEVVPYSPNSVAQLLDGQVRRLNGGGNYYSEYKFKRSSWHGFIEQYIARDILDRITLGSPVSQVDRTGERVLIAHGEGVVTEADRVLITVPTKVLQGDSISFNPALPDAKRRAIDSIHVPGGLKVFMEFSERFYPDITLVGELMGGDPTEKIFYDAAFRKQSERHILGLFCVGAPSARYAEMTEAEIVDSVLDELDEAFDGQASAAYMNHVVQNWSADPFIQGSYSFDFGDDEEATIQSLAEPVESRLYFAGESTSTDNWSTVPGAMQSGYAAVEAMLR